jgi:hypothetical protein
MSVNPLRALLFASGAMTFGKDAAFLILVVRLAAFFYYSLTMTGRAWGEARLGLSLIIGC